MSTTLTDRFAGGPVNADNDRRFFHRMAEDVLTLRDIARQKRSHPSDPIWNEYSRIKSGFIKLAILVGETDAAKRLIERI